MPSYTGRCEAHGEFDEILKVSQYLLDGLKCPICHEAVRVIIRKAPGVIGPMPSKRLDIDQIGQSFGSRAEEKAYFARHPNRAIVAKNDAAFVNHRDLAREKAEKAARRMGYRDLDDRKTKAKEEKAHKRRIALGDKKIQITT